MIHNFLKSEDNKFFKKQKWSRQQIQVIQFKVEDITQFERVYYMMGPSYKQLAQSTQRQIDLWYTQAMKQLSPKRLIQLQQLQGVENRIQKKRGKVFFKEFVTKQGYDWVQIQRQQFFKERIQILKKLKEEKQKLTTIIQIQQQQQQPHNFIHTRRNTYVKRKFTRGELYKINQRQKRITLKQSRGQTLRKYKKKGTYSKKFKRDALLLKINKITKNSLRNRVKKNCLRFQMADKHKQNWGYSKNQRIKKFQFQFQYGWRGAWDVMDNDTRFRYLHPNLSNLIEKHQKYYNQNTFYEMTKYQFKQFRDFVKQNITPQQLHYCDIHFKKNRFMTDYMFNLFQNVAQQNKRKQYLDHLGIPDQQFNHKQKCFTCKQTKISKDKSLQEIMKQTPSPDQNRFLTCSKCQHQKRKTLETNPTHFFLSSINHLPKIARARLTQNYSKYHQTIMKRVKKIRSSDFWNYLNRFSAEKAIEIFKQSFPLNTGQLQMQKVQSNAIKQFQKSIENKQQPTKIKIKPRVVKQKSYRGYLTHGVNINTTKKLMQKTSISEINTWERPYHEKVKKSQQCKQQSNGMIDLLVYKKKSLQEKYPPIQYQIDVVSMISDESNINEKRLKWQQFENEDIGKPLYEKFDKKKEKLFEQQ